MAKFAVGEIAVLLVGATQRDPWGYGGSECEIVRVGPFVAGELATGPPRPGISPELPGPADYEIRTPDGWHWFVLEKNLRKRPQRGIPDEVLRLFEQPITEDATA